MIEFDVLCIFSDIQYQQLRISKEKYSKKGLEFLDLYKVVCLNKIEYMHWSAA